MTDIAEVRAAVGQAREVLPVTVLSGVADLLAEQHSRLAGALTGTANDTAKSALVALGAAAESAREAVDAHEVARRHCEDYLRGL